MPVMPLINVADAPLQEQAHGERFQAKLGKIGPALGLTELGCTLHVVPPGKRAYPFHAHHVIEELFVVLSGEGEYRFGDRTCPIKAGDVIGAPAGKTAHQLINTGSHELRFLGVSTVGAVDVCEYPDSNKVAIAAGVKNADFKTATIVYVTPLGKPVEYWDGEK